MEVTARQQGLAHARAPWIPMKLPGWDSIRITIAKVQDPDPEKSGPFPGHAMPGEYPCLTYSKEDSADAIPRKQGWLNLVRIGQRAMPHPDF